MATRGASRAFSSINSLNPIFNGGAVEEIPHTAVAPVVRIVFHARILLFLL